MLCSSCKEIWNGFLEHKHQTCLFEVLVSEPLLTAGSGSSSRDRRLAFLAAASGTLRFLLGGSGRLCSSSSLCGEHFVAETISQLAIFLGQFAKAVLRNPVVPAVTALEAGCTQEWLVDERIRVEERTLVSQVCSVGTRPK